MESQILFTASPTLLGRAIRYLTNEPMSHVAVRSGMFVAHSTVCGVEIITYEAFIRKGHVVGVVDIEFDNDRFLNLVTQYEKSFYDYGCLFYLGLRYCAKRYLGIPLPKANLWCASGMFTCTEWVSAVVDGRQDSMITPYQLYLRLTEKTQSRDTQ